VDALGDFVSPSFFRTTAIPLLQGREFTWTDVSSGPNVVILNRSLADRLFPRGDRIGETVSISFGSRDQVAAVIGIAADAATGDPRLSAAPQFYLPLVALGAPALVLRLSSGPISEASLRAAIEPFGHRALGAVTMMREHLDWFLRKERLLTSTSLLFAFVAGLITSIGLYTTMSQNILHRSREIAIRVAVGATPNRVRALVVQEVGWVLLIGIALGLPAALGGGHAARSLLSGGSPQTLVLLAVTGSALVVLALLVSVWPAQRAVRTDVVAAVRAE
jgi:hypothetical protein